MKLPEELIEINRESYDGVIPTHYPATYKDLYKLCCVSKISREDHLYVGLYTGELTCEMCYPINNYPIFEIVERRARWHSTSMVGYVHKNCRNCTKPLLKIRVLTTCHICMDAYFTRKEAFEI